ncbi:stomatin-like protein [Ophiostoma piceae UAMH 11346]|uniref:Stomatin-like protein n=1 Tax=Ophiostoma piceae (strain UAMH 11346) TaxID=1262450 RepID=S3CM20_OPHP1|nr:stomatin-like protein [Ophiostoma piceae UAMH 11346]
MSSVPAASSIESDAGHAFFSPSAGMSAPAGPSTDANGATKSVPDVGFRPQANMAVVPPRKEDLQMSYASIVGDDHNPSGWYGSMINSLGACIGTVGAIPCCICCPNPYKSVGQGNVGLVTKFGRFYKAVDPGLVKINPLSERLIQVDVKIQIVEVPQQVCMTKDNVTVRLTSVIYYHIVSPHKAAFGIANVRQALIERTQTTLRHVVGARVLQEVVERREEIAQSIGEIIEDVAAGWGVQVESMLMKDIVFTAELQESLSMAAQSKRIGESKIIAARAEVESAKLMRQAADILSSAPAMQIRYLEAMQAMAKSANSKVIFLPAANQTMPGSSGFDAALRQAAKNEAGESGMNEFSGQDPGFQQAVNARVIENI